MTTAVEYSVEEIARLGQPILDQVLAVPEIERIESRVIDIIVDGLRALSLPEDVMDILSGALAQYIDANNLVNRFVWDDFMQAMASGSVSWGDLCLEGPIAPRKKAAVEDDAPREMPEDWDYDFPTLKLRKDIWTHFPVTCEPLGRGADGAERHAIVWHRKNLVQWRQERPESFDEWMDYEMIQERRLFKCLEANARWTVEEPLNDRQICVIRMNFAEEGDAPVAADAGAAATAPVVTPVSAVAHVKERLVAADPEGWAIAGGPRRAADAVPVLLRLNDIRDNFPVVWHDVSTNPRVRVYALEIHGTKMRTLCSAAGRDVSEETRSKLMRALKASSAWRVLASEGREFCRLEMA
jgi:hypothetical protein